MIKLKAIFKIIRPLNILITFISVLVAGIIASGENTIPQLLILAALAESFTFSAGNVINDVFDIEIDKTNRPERVLPNGQLNKPAAVILYIFLISFSIFISFYISKEVFYLILLTNVLLFLYSFILKKTILIDNLLVALIVGSAFIVGAAAVGNIKGGYIPFIFALLINFAREIVKDMEDIKGDTSVGIKSFPSVYGFNASKILISISIIFLIIITFYPYVFDLYGLYYLLIILIVVNPFLIFILFKLFKKDTVTNFRTVSKYLKIAMVLGLIAIYAG